VSELGEQATRSYWSCFSDLGAEWLDVRHEYGDLLGHRYEYDSHVINHARVAVGDVLVVRDRYLVLGFGVVERIDRRLGVKQMRRCPVCRTADLSLRKRIQPKYRCNDGGHEFEVPLEVPTEVTIYGAAYGDRWYPLSSPIPVRALDDVYLGRDQQNAIRRLDEVRARSLLDSQTDVEGYLQLALLAHPASIPGGYVLALSRARVGQQQFRDALFDRYGPACAVTGPQPRELLDAAHLTPFASRPEHLAQAGLLLRADVHRMFDRLLLSFDPKDWTAHVAPQLVDRYPGMRSFDRRPMLLRAGARPDAGLLADHYSLARSRWRAPA